MKLSKELLKEIYEFVDENLKAKIENEVLEIKTTLEIGKWYRFKSGTIGFYNGFREKSYGFHCQGMDWVDDNHWFFGYEILKIEREATPEEVETAIKNECIRLGLNKGKVICLDDKTINKVQEDGNFAFSFGGNYMFFGGVMVYSEGKFATPITEPTEKDLLIEKLKELKDKANELENQIKKLS